MTPPLNFRIWNEDEKEHLERTQICKAKFSQICEGVIPHENKEKDKF